MNEPSSSLVTLAANVACGAFKKPARRGPVCPQSYCSKLVCRNFTLDANKCTESQALSNHNDSTMKQMTYLYEDEQQIKQVDSVRINVPNQYSACHTKPNPHSLLFPQPPSITWQYPMAVNQRNLP